MIQPKDVFANELEVFRKEAEWGIQFFYSYLAVHIIASENKEVLQLLNTASLFWKTVLGSLQTSTFITLGRLFDQRSKHSIDRLLKIAESNIAIFSKEALAGRKRRDSSTADEWLNDYLRDVYVPKADDFRRLRRYVKKRRKVYENNCRDIRHKYFAHKEISSKKDVQALFKRTNVREMQKILIFLSQLHEALLELYQNGRKPILRPACYSVKGIRRRLSHGERGPTLVKWVTNEIEVFLKTAVRDSKQY
jgi:hypothetical protein